VVLLPRSDLLNHRAVIHTGAATGTKVFDNTPGPFADLYLKVSGFTTDFLYICIGNKLNVQMPADLDQYR